MSIKPYLEKMIEQDASDLFYRAGGAVCLRVDGEVVVVGNKVLSVADVVSASDELMNHKQKEAFGKNSEIDFAMYSEELRNGFRVNIFLQKNSPSIVIRNIHKVIQTFEELNLPGDVLRKLSLETRGLVLLTGSMGSGKSTTIASMIEYINNNSRKHILTIEEPVEVAFTDKNCIINQRELGVDVSSYATGLRSFVLQSPDVLFIGNIRDYDTMSAAMTAAQTGVLVLSTLHTINASQTVERIINFFPPHQHQEIKNQLSSILKGVISLRLLPLKDGKGRVPAYEIMLLTPTISRLIREGKIWEIPQFIEDGAVYGMRSFNQSLVKLLNEGKITEEVAAGFSDNKEEFALALKGIKRV